MNIIGLSNNCSNENSKALHLGTPHLQSSYSSQKNSVTSSKIPSLSIKEEKENPEDGEGSILFIRPIPIETT